ncbi:MAG TPA: 16S rRNA (cytosine(967)-C(5))-methyltransferase RsmB [Chthoniobacterales bacterium]|nr:16S rRNA (cytosine(967)-C(5))-methyltransferase RsmB [Chthoniobacterales bacterium]
MKESSRSLAFAALKRWRNGTDFADKIVGESFARSPLASSDRAFAVELFYGVLRNLTLLDFWIAQLRSEPVDPRTRDLLRLGLYQVLLIETAAHAAVFETVELAPARVRSLVNAILRRSLREKLRLTNAAAAESLSVRFSTPAFLIEKWSGQFGAAQVVKLCQWNNRPPPVYVRINRLKTTAAEFLIRYPGSALLPGTQNFVRLPDPFAALENGDCYIQDPSTALACELLRPRAGESVLDACAAPGGKTIYLAEMMQNEGAIVVADLNENRLQRLRDNLARLEVRNVRTVRCDWRDESSIQSAPFRARSFDKILLDAPCTNTGVMRRRVDLRWRLRPEDFSRMHRLQLEILRAVVPLLKPGGSLVYSTCSLEREENAEVIETFLGEERGFRLTRFEETLPFRDSLDGAFAARLELSASGS